MDTTRNKMIKEASDGQSTTQIPKADATAFDQQVQDVHDTVLVSGDLIREELRRRGVLEEDIPPGEPASAMPVKPATAKPAPAKPAQDEPAQAPAEAAGGSAASESAPAGSAPASPVPAKPGRTPVVDVTDNTGDETPHLLVDAEHSKFRVDLGEDAIVIGRARECDLVIPALTVSRQHARLGCSEKGWWLADLDADNGTYLNGERVGQSALMDGDVIQVGDAKLTFHLPQSCAHQLPTVMRVLPPATPEQEPAPPQAPQAAPAAAAQPAKSGGGKGLLILVVVMLVAVCAMLAILLVKSNVFGSGGGSEERAGDSAPKTAAVLAEPAPSPPNPAEQTDDTTRPADEQEGPEATTDDTTGEEAKPSEAVGDAEMAEAAGVGVKPAAGDAEMAEAAGAGAKPAAGDAETADTTGVGVKPAAGDAETADAAGAEAKPVAAGEDERASTGAARTKKPLRKPHEASSGRVVGRKIARHTPRGREEAVGTRKKSRTKTPRAGSRRDDGGKEFASRSPAGGPETGVFEKPSGALLRAQSLQAYLAGDVKAAIESARDSGVRSDGVKALERIERIHARCYELYRTSKQSRPVKQCLHDALELDGLLGGGKGKIRERIRGLLSRYHTHLAVAAHERGDQPEAYRQSVLALGFDAGFEKARSVVLQLAGEARGLYQVARDKQHLEPARAVQLCERAMQMVPASSGIHQRCRELIARLTRSPD